MSDKDIIYSILNEVVAGYYRTPDAFKNQFLIDKTNKLESFLAKATPITPTEQDNE